MNPSVESGPALLRQAPAAPCQGYELMDLADWLRRSLALLRTLSGDVAMTVEAMREASGDPQDAVHLERRVLAAVALDREIRAGGFA